MRYIKGVSRRQKVLFPESLDDYIGEDNPVKFINSFVDSLDLVKLGFKHAEPEQTGRPPYNPADLLKLYIYGYLNRIRSSRGLERETGRNTELMWLLRKLRPDFKTISDFRKDNKKAIKAVSREFVILCKKLSLFSGELIAIDGSKFKAVNSKKRNFNEKQLAKKIRDIDSKIEQYLKQLDGNDEAEKGSEGFSEEELGKKLEELKKRRGNYKRLVEGLKEKGENQVSLTDADSRAMVSNQRTDVGYNVQTAVDEKHKLILDYRVTNEANDTNQLSKMSKRAKGILGVERLDVLADKGYYNAEEVKECVDNGIMPYIPEHKSRVSKKENIPCPEYYKDKFIYEREKDIYVCPEGRGLRYKNTVVLHGRRMRTYESKECCGCESKKYCTQNKRGRIIYRWEYESLLEEMRERVKAETEKVKKRNLMNEHIFGTIKRNFNQGYFLMKGMDNIGAEMGLTTLAYNIRRVLNIIGIDDLITAVKLKSNEIFNNLGNILIKTNDFFLFLLKTPSLSYI
jgi:transposase